MCPVFTEEGEERGRKEGEGIKREGIKRERNWSQQ
jgi:hypothetical protein